LQVAAERGLLGLAGWLAIWSLFFYHTWRLYGSLEPPAGKARALVAGSLGSVVGFHVAGLFENNFGDSEVISLVYFLMALPFVVQYSHGPHTVTVTRPQGRGEARES
jgi:hypothetical protein